MGLRWRPNGGHAIAPSFVGFDASERLVAQVVRYQRPDGWAAFARLRRVPGPIFDDVGDAQMLAEIGVELLELATRQPVVARAVRQLAPATAAIAATTRPASGT